MVNLLFLLLIPIMVIPGFVMNPQYTKFFCFTGLLVIGLFLYYQKSKKLTLNPWFLQAAFLSTVSIIPALRFGISENLFYFSIQFIFFLFLSIDYIDISKTQTIFKFLSLSSLIVQQIAFLNYFGISPLGFTLFGTFNSLSMVSTIGNVNLVMDFLGSVIFVVLLSMFKLQGKIWKSISVLSFYFSFQVLLWGQTRSVLLGVCLSSILMCILLLITKKWKKLFQYKFLVLRILIIGIFAICMTFFTFNSGKSAFSLSMQRIEDAVSGTDNTGSLSSRQYMAEIALEMFKDNPIFGQGYGSYKLLSADYGVRISSREGPFYGIFMKTYEAHNDFLQWLAEFGLFGFFLWVLAIVYILYQAFSNIKNKSVLEWCMVQGIIVIITHSFFEFPLYMMPSMMIFGFFAKFLTQNTTKKEVSKKLFPIFFILLLPFIIIQFRMAIADGLFKYYQTHENYNQEATITDPTMQFNQKLKDFFMLSNAYSIHPSDYFIIYEWGNVMLDLSKMYPPLLTDLISVPEFIYNDLTLKIRKAPTTYPYIPTTINTISIFDQEVIILQYEAFVLRTLALNAPIDPYIYYYIAGSGRELYDSLDQVGLLEPEIKDSLIQWIDYGYSKSIEMKGYNNEYQDKFWQQLPLEMIEWKKAFNLLSKSELEQILGKMIKFGKNSILSSPLFLTQWNNFFKSYIENNNIQANDPFYIKVDEWVKQYNSYFLKNLVDPGSEEDIDFKWFRG